MSGFNNAIVDAAFFPDGRFKSNFLCNIGYGDHAKLFNRSPRLRSRKPAPWPEPRGRESADLLHGSGSSETSATNRSPGSRAGSS